jgi:DNA/RNA endonuclease G (NUC1)
LVRNSRNALQASKPLKTPDLPTFFYRTLSSPKDVSKGTVKKIKEMVPMLENLPSWQKEKLCNFKIDIHAISK